MECLVTHNMIDKAAYAFPYCLFLPLLLVSSFINCFFPYHLFLSLLLVNSFIACYSLYCLLIPLLLVNSFIACYFLYWFNCESGLTESGFNVNCG